MFLRPRLDRLPILFLSSALSALTICNASAQDVITFHNDNSRSAVQASEVTLTKSNVNATSFGKTLTFAVDGDVYAQPLYLGSLTMSDGKLHNVLFVATEHDFVYAFDANGNNPAVGYLWRTSLIPSSETWVSSGDVGTGDITPDIGVTGTPVIDRGGSALYVVAKSKTTSGTTVFTQRLHALNLSDGTEKLSGPTVIQATVSGTGGGGGSTVSFDPLRNNQRPGLLLAATPGGVSGSSVYLSWASHGDNTPYHGWVISYNSANISQQTGVWNVTPNGGQGGIWMSGGGLATDGAGNIFGASGNGTFDANTGGLDYGDSLFKLTASSSGLSLTDWFTPIDQSSLNGSDSDFGVSGPVLLPVQSGSIPHLVVTSDKTGQIYLANRDNMGHFSPNVNQDVQDFGDGGNSIHSNFAFFNNQLYLAPDGGPAETWAFNTATGKFSTAVSSKSVHTFGCNGCDGAGSNLAVSSNGTQNGIVWAIDYSSFGNGPAVLYAFDASNLATQLYASSQSANNRDQAPTAVKFVSPTIANGTVYVAGRNAVVGYGLLNTTLPTATAPSFSPGGGSYAATQTVTISDSTTGATIHYTTDGSTPTTSSAVYSAPLTISTTTTLQALATAPSYNTSAVSTAVYTISSSSGSGTVSFGSGFTATGVTFNGFAKLNGSRLRLTDGGVNEGGSAFYSSTLNVQSFVTDFSFQLTNPNADGMAFVIQNAGKTALGPAGGGLGYGPDHAGGTGGIPTSIAVKFDLYNNAGEGVDSTGLYVNGASPTLPSIDLTSSGVNLHSGDVFQIHAVYNGTVLVITIRDSITGKTATQSYTVNIPQTVGSNQAYVGFSAGTGGKTATQEVLTWTYSPQPYYATGFAATNLTLNGGAALSGTKLRLTDGGNNELRSAFYTTPVQLGQFASNFTFQLTNPNADGFTFTLQGVAPTALDSTTGGGGLGYGPDMPGGAAGIAKSVAVKFDLYNNAGEGTDSTGLYTNGVSPTTPAVDLSNSGVNLHSGDVFTAILTYNGTTLTVTITDTATKATATQTYTVNIPSTVGSMTGYVGFTAGTGGASATQDIQNWTYSTK